MEKQIIILLNLDEIEYLAVKKTTTIASIKKYLEKYGDVKIQMAINSKKDLKVFDTDQYDNMNLDSVWKKMKTHAKKRDNECEDCPKIYLTSYRRPLTGIKDLDLKIM